MSMKRWGAILGSLALALACARTGHSEENEEKEEKPKPEKKKEEKIPLDTTSSIADLLKGAMSADTKVYKHCTDSLLARGSKAAPDLTKIACDPKQELPVRRTALRFLTEAAPNDCSDAIETLLADPVKDLRMEAVRACAKAQAEELVAPLQKAAANPKTDPDVVRECWKALYALHETKAGKTPLTELFRGDLKHATAAYRWEAARTLGEMWDPLESTCRHASLSIL